MDKEPLPSQIGPYRIVRLLGQGGMGVVYEALQESIGRRVALKVLLPEYARQRDVVTRFFNEARAVNCIEHPSIVQVSEFAQLPDGTAYLVMEYLRGESLSSRLERLHSAEQRLSLGEALQLAAQMADALHAAHEQGIVHRDIKPANVMLVRDSAVAGGERAKILDFGIAKWTQGQVRGTDTHVVMGTPQYMSPEQCRGAGGVDDKTDVYALGVILYETLAGRTPFLGEGSGEFIGQHLFMEPPSLRSLAPKLPVEVVTLVHRLLIKDKAKRPAMGAVGQELVRMLSRLSGDIPAQARTPVLPGLATPKVVPSTLGHSLGETMPAVRSSRPLMMLGAASILAAAIGIGLASHLWPRSTGRPTLTPATQKLLGTERTPPSGPVKLGPEPIATAPTILSPATPAPVAAKLARPAQLLHPKVQPTQLAVQPTSSAIQPTDAKPTAQAATSPKPSVPTKQPSTRPSEKKPSSQPPTKNSFRFED